MNTIEKIFLAIFVVGIVLTLATFALDPYVSKLSDSNKFKIWWNNAVCKKLDSADPNF